LIADPAAAAEIDNVLNNLEYLEIKILLRSTLKKALTPSQQQAIQLRYYDGYNVENTADIMGVALEKARQLEKTAIKELRKKTESTAPLHKFYQERRGAYE
ncbi:MAG: hypothetical protein GX800_12970, partial [Clostridiaceae bacterium]|nr:hypothetical protein [Clostridiaceae bacterium]